jgi:hypothetical protein
MDSYRGFPVDTADDTAFRDDFDGGFDASLDEDFVPEPPPSPVGQDERRMQVRAYNHWASLLGDRPFPTIAQYEKHRSAELEPNSVMLDFSQGIENPAVAFLGDKLAQECGNGRPIRRLSDVPGRSLLSRITDHYMQIIANEAPIGFEAEFVNQRGSTYAYRGILLPFSQDGETIEHILGVINWKELADQATTDALLLELDAAIGEGAATRVPGDAPDLSAWADGPDEMALLPGVHSVLDEGGLDRDVLDLSAFDGPGLVSVVLPEPGFGQLVDIAPEPVIDGVEIAGDDGDLDLAASLALARASAEAARTSQDRTRHALYDAIGMAYDFALAAFAEPRALATIMADAALTMQERAPMTPLVKLVFGGGYDKTRLTEYATALGHARRIGIEAGALADYLLAVPGGLKGVVAEERRFKRAGTPRRAPDASALVRRLRKLPAHALAPEGEEFAVVLMRRAAGGEIQFLGEIADDAGLLQRAARRLSR